MSTALKKEVVAEISANRRAKPVVGAPSPFAELCNALPDPLMTFDKNMNVHYTNHATQEIFDISGNNTTGLAEIFDKNTPVLDAVEKMLASGQPLTLHDLRIGNRMTTSLFLLPLVGTELFMMTIRFQPSQISSIEWTQKARQALKPAQTMARMLAHEIKNPLAGIRVAAQLLSRVEMEKDDRELLDLITRETDRLAKLADKVNIFDEGPEESSNPLNIHQVLDHVANLARTSFPAIDIQKKYDPSLPEIRGSFDHLVQAMLNLMKNAAEAECSAITMRTFFDTAAVFHAEHHQKLSICVEIHDNGKGIDPETQACMFNPYFTTKARGEGLGLSIVSKIVDDHRGAIDVASTPSRTIFTIRFPMVKA